MADSTGVSTEAKSAAYNGSCHCGKIKFTMKISPPVEEGNVTICNCSICSKKGLLMVYPRNTDIEWISGYDEMAIYQFGPKRINQLFCPTCGTDIGGKSNKPDFFPDNTAINVRTLEGVDFDALKLHKFDGKNIDL